MKRTYPDDENNYVSHETIYRSLFIPVRGTLKKELLQHLGRKRAMRRSRHKNLKGEYMGQITATVSINERPGKTLNFETPAERFNQCVASIG